jgi:hypothetical protein
MITQKEIIENAVRFSKEWKDAERENSDKQTFWNEFFQIFGIERKKVAKFEETVKKYGGNSEYVDLFWKGELIVEHKSKNLDLDGAYGQALKYCEALKQRDKPKYIIVSDFARIRVYDIREGKSDYEEIKLAELPKNTDLFGFISGYSRRKYREEEPINKEGALLIGDLHDVLWDANYRGEDLERFLVRILFCLFADDTTIFPKGIFREFIDEDTYEDGSNVGAQLIHLFQVLNTPENKRQTTLHDRLKVFPYVNGALFADRLDTPSFTKAMRGILLECCYFDWSEISPAIFGTMFQAIIHGIKRDELGAHYTSETNIMKAVHGLFLDELQEEFDRAKNNSTKLKEFHNKIASLKFLDPACGCGNFLVITYREMRRFEIEILKQLRVLSGSRQIAIPLLQSQIQLDSFYGIEYDMSAVRISEVAMWLMEHKMNEALTGEFGKYIATIPLKKSPHIICENALRFDWKDLVSNQTCSYIIGNPPFVSQENRTKEQQDDMKLVFGTDGGVLDYVCAWYKKASDYIEGTRIKVALVSTNSITQGVQVGALWQYLFPKNIQIHFAHRTFKWNNEAKGQAQVFVVIIGFANFDTDKKYIYDYATPRSEPFEIKAKTISPYLIDFDNTIISDRTNPISSVSKMFKGSQPTDAGNFLFTDEEKKEFLNEEPDAKKFIHPFISSREYINGRKRWCLWLADAEPAEYRGLPKVMERVRAVKAFRLLSTKPSTVKWANNPTKFTENRQPKSNYILVPSHSSELRDYVPMGFLTRNDILNNSCFSVPNASFYEFGILTSQMHMAWMRQVCGRIKSDYRYSNTIVYNNFPFPENVSDKNKALVQQKVKNILGARANHPKSSLADLYDPDTMPNDLRKAHQELDKAVDNCYGNKTFKTEMERVAFLFGLYKATSEPLLKAEKPKRKAKSLA